MSSEFELYLDRVMEGFDVSTSPATNMGAPFTNNSQEIDDDGSVITTSLEDEDILKISQEQRESLENALEEFASEATDQFTDVTKAIESLFTI